MSSKIFIDSSAWIAHSLAGEPKHEQVVELIKKFIIEHAVLCTSNDVINETVTRLIYDTNPKITAGFLQFIQQSIERKLLVQMWTDEQIQAEAFILVRKYADQKVSLTDATSVVLMKRFNVDAILTLDSDFAKIGLRVLPQ